MTEPRRLVSLRRRVPPAREAAYRSAWDALAAVVTAGGAHAWRFVSASDAQAHLEFLEFGAASDPRDGEEVRRLLDRLDAQVATAIVEEWLENR